MLRRTRTLSARTGALALVVLAAAPILGAVRSAEAVFRYFSRKNLAQDLAAEPDKWVDSDVTVTDELAYVYPANPASDTEVGTGKAYTRFDTVYFRCAVETSKKGEYLDALWTDAKKSIKDILEQIDAIDVEQRERKKSVAEADKARRELYWQAHARYKAQPIVTLFGKVSRADFSTPSGFGGKADPEAKSRPEPITLIIERVEKPRDRFYEALDD